MHYDLREAILARNATLTANAYHIRVSQNHRLEALTAGYGAKKFASVSATFGEGVPHLSMFDQGRMAERMADLTDQRTADIVELLADGVSVQVTVTKDRVQSARYSDISYRVHAQVTGLEALTQVPVFVLPQKTLLNGREPFRVDSAHDRRVDSGKDATLGRSGQLLEAKLVNGHWHGGLYVYDQHLQQNDADCLSWVRHSLTRAIYGSLVPIVRCDVYRPLNYQAGIWCVRLRVHPDVTLPRTTFMLPQLDFHNIPMNANYFADVDVGVLNHGRWEGEVYPSGQKGLDNMLTADEVRLAFLGAAKAAVAPYLSLSPALQYRPPAQFASSGSPV